MPRDTDAAALAVDRARWWLLRSVPFWGTVAGYLADEFDPAAPNPAATDGKRIVWEPHQVCGWSAPELRYVLLHEVAHCVQQHFARLPHDVRGNVAGDMEINVTVLSDIRLRVDQIRQPAGALYDARFRDVPAELILQQLPPDPPAPVWGAFTAPDGDTDTAATKALAERWQQATIAAAMATAQGDLPAGIRRLLADLVAPPQVDWRAETAEFVRATVAARLDYSRAARRLATEPVIYPRRRPRPGRVICARDTSGSISDDVCAQFAAAIDDARATLDVDVIVMDADAAIQSETRLTAGAVWPDRATRHGAGGTDFRPVFVRAAEISQAEPVAGIIYLTDLEGAFPAASDIPTLWVSTRAHPVPFGRVVVCD